jgi:hypothetical protein
VDAGFSALARRAFAAANAPGLCSVSDGVTQFELLLVEPDVPEEFDELEVPEVPEVPEVLEVPEEPAGFDALEELDELEDFLPPLLRQ